VFTPVLVKLGVKELPEVGYLLWAVSLLLVEHFSAVIPCITTRKARLLPPRVEAQGQQWQQQPLHLQRLGRPVCLVRFAGHA
jgi:hypothetical protein